MRKAKAIEVRGLHKQFRGGVRALDGLDLDLPTGTVCGLLGRNGAGKTTLLRILMGLMRADSGDALVLGHDLCAASRMDRARVAYVAQQPQLVGPLTTAEHARMLACFYPTFDQVFARELARRFDVGWDSRFTTLSGGAQRKAAVLLAIAARPQVLLLDEPGAGLDPIARRELVDVLVDLLASGTECTVVLSTHLVDDVERLAERVAFVDAGRVVRTDTVERLKARLRRVQVVFDGDPPAGFTVPGARHTERAGSVVTAVAEIDSEDVLAPILALPGARMDVFGLTLEDCFVELVGATANDVERTSDLKAVMS